MDTMQGLKRTHYCGEVLESELGKEIVVAGFVQRGPVTSAILFHRSARSDGHRPARL